jgi:hypothetical protein
MLGYSIFAGIFHYENQYWGGSHASRRNQQCFKHFIQGIGRYQLFTHAE